MWPTLLILSIFALLTFDATAAQDPFEQEVTLNVNDQETFSYKIKKRELGTDEQFPICGFLIINPSVLKH